MKRSDERFSPTMQNICEGKSPTCFRRVFVGVPIPHRQKERTRKFVITKAIVRRGTASIVNHGARVLFRPNRDGVARTS